VGLSSFVSGSQKIESEAQKRKIILGGYLILMYMFIDFFFFIVNLFNPQGDPTSLFIGFVISIVAIWILRKGWTDTALYLHFLRSNGLAFYFSVLDHDPLQTGTPLYFILSCFGALAVFGYRESWKGIGLTAISFILFLIAILKPDEFSPDQAHFYFIVNFLITLLMGVLLIIFFDRLVTQSEARILLQNNELSKTNAELDSFVYKASHDLRSPLSSILGLAEIASKMDDVNEIKSCITMIKDRVNVQDRFIKDIIDYARNSRQELTLEKVKLKAKVTQIIDSLIYNEGARGIDFKVAIPDDLEIVSDPIRLSVIFSNLIGNAIKYQDSTKEYRNVVIGLVPASKALEVYVEDNGIGIEEQYHSKIFTMFFRATEKSKGSGLGLFIVKESVQKLGGSIGFASTVGKGTVFTFSLPNKVN
jgi:signal transduction histidine kinase